MKGSRRRPDPEHVNHSYIVLPAESTGPLYDLIRQLPHSILALSHFTVASAADGHLLCQSDSVTSQQAADEAIAALPLDTRLTVAGVAHGIERKGVCLVGEEYDTFPVPLDEVRICFEVTLSEADSMDDRVSGAVPSHPSHRALLLNQSVRLTTSLRLLPGISVPLSAQLPLHGRLKDAAERAYSSELARGESMVAFYSAEDADAQPHPPFRLGELLEAHARIGSDNQLLSTFTSLSPLVHLASVVLVYAPSSGQPFTLEVEVQSDARWQWRGFHIDRPRLRLKLLLAENRYERCEPSPAILGQAEATYCTTGSDVLTTCRAAVSIDNALVLTGDSRSVLQMAEVLAANALARNTDCAQLPAATSHTTLGLTLLQQLPWLVPSSPPAPPAGMAVEQAERLVRRFNRVTCPCDLASLAVNDVQYHDLTLRLVDASLPSPSDATPCVILSCTQPRGGPFTQFRLRPWLHSQCQSGGRFNPSTDKLLTSGLLLFAQLLSCIGMPTTLIPPALLQRVLFSDVNITLLVKATSGVATCMLGSACCGVSRRDKLVFYNRLAPTSIEADVSSSRAAEDHLQTFSHSSVCRSLRLQCRAVLDAAVFPQLAVHTAGRCLEPLYEYVLCETEGDVALSSEQSQALARADISHHQRDAHHSFPPQPMNAVLALQPHLPSGCLELPLTALASPARQHSLSPAPTAPTSSLPFPSSCTSAASAHFLNPPCAPSRLLNDLFKASTDLLFHCLDFLDTNSLLFGLLPALHAVPAVATALSGAYSRRVLLSRYSAWCDCALWSEALLQRWRMVGFNKQRRRAVGNEGFPDAAEATARACEPINREQEAANRREVYWAAIADLQRRINRFLVRVMQQRKEDVLPQLYERPHDDERPRVAASAPQPGTVRPVFLSPPDAALALLLCVPPFHPIPRTVQWNALSTADEGVLSDDALNNASLHRVDFAGFLSRTRGSDERSPWLLNMGPVYVYESEHTAGKGCAVRLDDVLRRRDAWNRPLVDGEVASRLQRPDTRVRLLYVDDVNQLPVTSREPFTVGYTHLYALTLAVFFRANGVAERIDRRRQHWKQVALGHAAQQKQKKGRKRGRRTRTVEREEAEEETEEYKDGCDNDADHHSKGVMHDRDGAALEYVDPLMAVLFQRMDEAMGREPTWTKEAAMLAAAAASMC